MVDNVLPGGQPEKAAVKKSLALSMKDGVAYAATMGFGDHYFNPFAVALGASSFQIGLLSASTQLFPAFAQFKAADITERIGSRKRIVAISVFFQSFMLLPIAMVPYLPQVIQINALMLFCTLYLVFASFANPPWGSLMASLVPESIRGEFFGKRGRIVGVVTVFSAFLAGYLLHLFKKPPMTGFTVIFLIAMACRYATCYLLGKMYEPPLEIREEHYFSFADFVRRLNAGNFGRYVVFHSTFSFAVFIASPFFPVFMLRDLGFSYITYTIVTTTVPLAGIAGVGYWGRRADVIGNRRVIRICSLVVAVLPALWLVSRQVYFLLVIQALAGMFWAGINLCSSNFIYDSVTPEKRTRCISYFNTFNGIAICLGNLLGGFLATHIPPVFGYRMLSLFALSSFLRIVVSTVLLGRVREVRKGAHSPTWFS